jgi:predicted  nucleic acid-binding Zn-ribbon protein
MSPPLTKAGSDPVEVEEYAVKVEPEEIDDSDDQVLVVPRRRKKVERWSPASSVDTSPPLSSTPSFYPERLPYYTVVNTKHRPPGSGIRFAPNQRQIAKTPAAIYARSRVLQPVAGPSHPATKVGPPKYILPDRTGPKLRPATEVPPPRPPQPLPGLAALEARMNAFVEENQKLRDELATAKNDLMTARSELTAALTRVDTVEHDLNGLEAVELKLEEMKGDYGRLSNLLSSEHLFDSERFRTTIQGEVKNSFGYYWPSAKNDMKNQLWKEIPPKVKEYVDEEIGKAAEQVALVRSEVVEHNQKLSAGGNVQSVGPTMAELMQAIGRVEKKQEELEATVSNVERAQEFERTQRGSTSTVARLTPKDVGNSTCL